MFNRGLAEWARSRHFRPSDGSSISVSLGIVNSPCKAFRPRGLQQGDRYVPVSQPLTGIWSQTSCPWRAENNEAAQEALQLALDALLEVDVGGKFISGTKLLQILQTEGVMQSGCTTNASGKISSLSGRALRLAQAWPSHDHYSVVGALYFFNRLPSTSLWRKRLPGPEACEQFLGLSALDTDPDFHSTWRKVRSEPEWMLWRRRDDREKGIGYKLYVSVQPESLARCLVHAANVFAATGAHAFKIGVTLHGLLRPDNLIGYFQTWEQLERAAGALVPSLQGVEARGVPFTVSFEDSEALSWGQDPDDGSLARIEGGSWRLWLCSRLAHGLEVARAEDAPAMSPATFTQARLPAWGLDPASFTPLASSSTGLPIIQSSSRRD